ncbi:murein transglycosylase A [Pelobacter sp. M08fum]|uniref:peptidoglycan lytic exotransglycosylase n=2 Tax=Pelovirga terrestris TaxID=2771352 RepID=A0A8J6UIJ5_9BACT|nr:murein transglycosylase A [Pelovirga terrestris]
MITVLFLVVLAGCAKKPPVEIEPPIIEPPVVEVPALTPVTWEHLDGWEDDSLLPALEAFRNSCVSLRWREQWRDVCSSAQQLDVVDVLTVRNFFEQYFTPHQVRNADGSTSGLMTGYYGPELEGSREPTEEYRYPLYQQPDDMLIIDLDSVYPELGNYRLRGRVEGNRVVPYFDREQIDFGDNQPLAGHELFWVKDPVDLFFLHIQGSGSVRLPNGEQAIVNYANQNGHPYRSIGRLLLDRNEMTRDQMSMQNIRRWVANNPGSGQKLLAENPSYVFFRELPPGTVSPPGAMGVPLTPLRSLAVDPRTIPLGAPVFLSTTFPGTENQPLRQLMVAQDTGGAIKGRVRGDFFWGMGNEAGEFAGRMRHPGELWVLLPRTLENYQGK